MVIHACFIIESRVEDLTHRTRIMLSVMFEKSKRCLCLVGRNGFEVALRPGASPSAAFETCIISQMKHQLISSQNTSSFNREMPCGESRWIKNDCDDSSVARFVDAAKKRLHERNC